MNLHRKFCRVSCTLGSSSANASLPMHDSTIDPNFSSRGQAEIVNGTILSMSDVCPTCICTKSCASEGAKQQD